MNAAGKTNTPLSAPLHVNQLASHATDRLSSQPSVSVPSAISRLLSAPSSHWLSATEQGQQDLILLHQSLGNQGVGRLLKEKSASYKETESSLNHDHLHYAVAPAGNAQQPMEQASAAGLGDASSSAIQLMASPSLSESSASYQSSPPNQTGLPDRLRAGIESLSGMSMDHVRVHYNSSKPAQLQAHAYTQGSEIYVGPGQQQHLPHEAWHVVQQAQGRVRPTLQLKGMAVNDDTVLEREADVMGRRAMMSERADAVVPYRPLPSSMQHSSASQPIQRQHVLVGAMIKGQDNPNASTGVNDSAKGWEGFPIEKIFNKSQHRGDLTNARRGSTFQWDETPLVNRIKNIRNSSGFADSDPNFLVVVNVNTYKTPGFESIPQDYVKKKNEHIYAFGSGWSLQYNLNPLSEGNDKPNYSDDYEDILKTWSSLPKDPANKGKKNQESNKRSNGAKGDMLGQDRAKQVLRHLSKKYWQANKNFVIPHRGLRNMVLEKIHDEDITKNLARKVQIDENSNSYTSILTLDDDLEIPSKKTVPNLMKQGEERSDGPINARNSSEIGIAFSTPGYIYNMENNLLEYTASVLSHIAGRVVKDSYPSEPGLMLTYNNVIYKDVWANFLKKSPWGTEDSNMKNLQSYGRKQTKARVESKEGRAFASQYAQYVATYRRNIKSADADDKIPVRSKDFVSVDMSDVAKKKIVGKNNPTEPLNALSKEKIKYWLNTYIMRNKYHPAVGKSQKATAFKQSLIPLVATLVKKVTDINMEDMEGELSFVQQDFIRKSLEKMDDDWYRYMIDQSDDSLNETYLKKKSVLKQEIGEIDLELELIYHRIKKSLRDQRSRLRDQKMKWSLNEDKMEEEKEERELALEAIKREDIALKKAEALEKETQKKLRKRKATAIPTADIRPRKRQRKDGS